jgi:hypothetical protein
MEIRLTSWNSSQPPAEAGLRAIMQREGLQPYAWSNGPHDVYSAHVHTFDKVIYAVGGSITFGLPHENLTLTLHPGDRLDLPAGTLHDAVVGSEGVLCLEAHL